MNQNHAVPLAPSEFACLLSHASKEPDFVFLGSTGEHGNPGRYQFFSARAATTVKLTPDASDSATERHDSAASLPRRLTALAEPFLGPVAGTRFPFPGGWAGYVSYEFGYLREARLAALCPVIPCPIFNAGLFLWIACYDRQTDQHSLFVHPDCDTDTVNLVRTWRTKAEATAPTEWRMTESFKPTQTREAFLGRLKSVQDYIQAGDCYQANLSQQFAGQYSGDPWHAFQALSRAHPTPFSAFLRLESQTVMSLSPERFLEIEDGLVETSPIKGTRPRGATPDEDAALAQELRESGKDQAENLMIVDLLRNDLSLNCQPGSVKVSQLFNLESYQNVHHLVSHIQGRLAPGIEPFKALLDAFPGGSITGAPKIRAMEIIHELEPHWRGPYCGSVFYWGLNGRIDSNIAIRTLFCDAGHVWCWGGGGIVADSDPASEYEETLTKVRPLMDFLESLR